MHAVAEYLLNHKTEWNNGTMVVLGIEDKIKLERWKKKLEWKNIKHSDFYEEDIGNELTAIACVDSGKVFKSLPLI